MARETAAQKNARTKAVLDERVRHFTETPNFYGEKLTPVQVRSAVVHEYLNGFSWRLHDMGIERDRYFKMAQALPSAFSWEELRASQKNPSKKPAYRSPAPEDCGCGSGLAPTLEVPLSRGRRACSRCYDDQRRFYRDEAYPSGGGEYGDDPSSGSGWHYSRNPPQRYTVTEGGRRVRLAGGNVFPSRGEAQEAVRFLRATDGGEYRVRPLKPGEHVGRVAAVNGRCAQKNSGSDVYYEVADVSTETGWRHIVMGRVKYDPRKTFAVVECKYGEPKCKLLRLFASRDKAIDYAYDLKVKAHVG